MARGNLENIKKQQEEKFDIPKDWLYQKYFIEKLSMKKIGNLIGSSMNTIRHRLKKYGFVIRKSTKHLEERKTIINKEDLYQRYILGLESSTKIATAYKCSNTTVLKYLKEYGIHARNGSEAKQGRLNPAFNKPSKKRGVKLTPQQIAKNTAALPRGKAHFRYKNPEDRIEPINNQIRNCQKSKDWKYSVLKRDNFCCVKCDSKEDIEIDHIIPFSVIRDKNNIKSLEEALSCEELWDINNGRVLCLKCHKETESYGFKGKKHIIKD
jgi:hypothetical protein